jgi:hypothetical protein
VQPHTAVQNEERSDNGIKDKVILRCKNKKEPQISSAEK